MTHSVLQAKCNEALRMSFDSASSNVVDFKRRAAKYDELATAWFTTVLEITEQQECEHSKFNSDRNFHTCVDCGASFQR